MKYSKNVWCRGVVVLSVQTHNAEIASSNPARLTIKTPLVKTATGNHLINATSLVKTQSSVSGFYHSSRPEQQIHISNSLAAVEVYAK